MKTSFGKIPSGQEATLYTISGGKIKATVSDLGATLVSIFVPDAAGNVADIVLGYDTAAEYITKGGFQGAIVGRNANRINGASFLLNGKRIQLTDNDSGNNLHSGMDFLHARMWTVENASDSAVTFRLDSPDGDQGYPGNATIRVTYSMDAEGALTISYDAISDADTVFNFTNHAFFNMAGDHQPEKALDQILQLQADYFTPADARSIPTGEVRSVEGTPFDFRTPKALGQDIEQDYEPLHLQMGYDHNFVIKANPFAVLTDPVSGRSMTVSTTCPGVHVYTANYMNGTPGKSGTPYIKRGAVCLETQFFPDAVNHPEWIQPFTKAGVPFHSETKFSF